MCQATNRPTWGVHPTQRVRVGDLAEGYVLASEGQDREGTYHCIWIRWDTSPLCVIDRITAREAGWYYRREFACDHIECAIRTFLSLLNPANQSILHPY